MPLRPAFPRAVTGLLAALMLWGCANGASSLPTFGSAPNSRYTLGTGDEVRVYVYGLDAFNNTTFVIGDDGNLSLPLLDKVRAGGKTFPELENGIKQALLSRQILTSPIVNVQPGTLRPFYVLGEVNKPGEYQYHPGMSVLAAVSMAGGFTFRADKQKVSITRLMNGRSVAGRAGQTDAIQPGDQIQVFERWF